MNHENPNFIAKVYGPWSLSSTCVAAVSVDTTNSNLILAAYTNEACMSYTTV